jgi:CubicO group peptidase (beta-lactamase class C family)
LKKLVAALFGVVALVAATLAGAQSLPQVTPEQAGFSAERLARIKQTLSDDIEAGALPGAVLLIAREGKIAYFDSFGALDPQTKSPMAKDSIFRIYSMTKPIVSVAAMMLVEEGRISLNDPIAKYLPEFKDVKAGVEKPGPDGKPTLELVAARRPITVQDLMRHTSGLTYGVFGDNLVKRTYRDANLFSGDYDNAEFSKRIAALPLMLQPGTQWEYSHATDVLGRLVEVVSGKSLYQFTKERILDPLGMTDTNFYVSDAVKHSRIAEPFANDRTIGIGAVVFDPRVAAKWESAGHGMMGTAIDYARFLQMLLDGGTFEGKRYLSPKTVAYMTSDHLGSIPASFAADGYGFGLGFGVRKQTGLSSLPGTEADYNWGGAGGTYFWVDPKEKMFVVFMMQAPKQRLYYRNLMRNMVYGAMIR